MPSNLDRYKKDLDSLIGTGEELDLAMQKECVPEQLIPELKRSSAARRMTYSRPSPSSTKPISPGIPRQKCWFGSRFPIDYRTRTPLREAETA